jgi:hypothetical protein
MSLMENIYIPSNYKKSSQVTKDLEGGLRSTFMGESSFIPIIGNFDHV